MTFEDFERDVRFQIQARQPARPPDDHAIQTAVMFYYKDLETIAIPQCAALAIRIAREYPHEEKDTGQPTKPPQGKQPAIDAEDRVNVVIDQAREQILGTGVGYCWPAEKVQAYLVTPSAGDILVPFCQDMASATKMTVLDVAMGVLARQPLALSAGNIGTVTYSVRMPQGSTTMLQWSTVELLTGNLSAHLVRDDWLPRMRQAGGHKPRQSILTKEDQERDRALRAFVDTQKQEWEWSHGRMPNEFWPSTWQAWNEQCKEGGCLEWQYNSNDAMRIAYNRLPNDHS